MKLIDISDSHFGNMLKMYKDDGGNDIDTSLSKLFECMNNESSEFEVKIKVAALNQLYSTAIQYITPVVEKIVSKIPENYKFFSEQEYSDLVDEIATVKWNSPTNRKEYSRHNLSFASKYVHFLSGRKIPIYDSYIWIVMVGYLKQNGFNKYSFSPPIDYNCFYNAFIKFKDHFNLNKRSNYEIDKFLWQYGKNMLDEIIEEKKTSRDKAKTVLKRCITSQST